MERIAPRLGRVRGRRPTPTPAEVFVAELQRHRAERPRPLPRHYQPLATAIVGDRPVRVASGEGSRRALSKVGKAAATTGDVIHLSTPRPTAEVIAHELTHVAHPSPVPRFFDDDDHSPEERRAEQVAAVMRRAPIAPRPSPSSTVSAAALASSITTGDTVQRKVTLGSHRATVPAPPPPPTVVPLPAPTTTTATARRRRRTRRHRPPGNVGGRAVRPHPRTARGPHPHRARAARWTLPRRLLDDRAGPTAEGVPRGRDRRPHRVHVQPGQVLVLPDQPLGVRPDPRQVDAVDALRRRRGRLVQPQPRVRHDVGRQGRHELHEQAAQADGRRHDPAGLRRRRAATAARRGSSSTGARRCTRSRPSSRASTSASPTSPARACRCGRTSR